MLLFLVLFYFIFFIIITFLPQSSSWPSFGYNFVSHISFTLVFQWSGALYFTFAGCLLFFFLFSLHLYYLFITVTYCQFISIYYLVNHYLLICSLITLKMYLVYTIISIFYYCRSNYISPQFLLHWKKNYLIFPIDTTLCDTELAFDCFVFSFPWVTLCDHSWGVEACVMFSYDII